MKKITLKAVSTAFMLMSIPFIQAQSKNATGNVAASSLNTGITYTQLTEENQQFFNETGYVKCTSVEMHERRMLREGNAQYNETFEQWLAPLIEARNQRVAEEKANGTFMMAVTNIPIIFHVITSGAGVTNLSQAQVQAQIDQLNIDFSNQAGSIHAAAADAMVQFVPALVDPSGNTLAQPGINRVTTFGAGPFPTSDFDGGDGGLEIKPNTIWDRSVYANIWTADITGGILGYAQFPSNSTLPGFNADEGTSLNDGVVIGYGTVGSVANPGSATPYNLGRTLTHEIGHWIGLRHIWGDGGCGVDDFCNDTPTAGGSNFGTAQNNSCGSADMVENYMDYTDDAIMNIFTADQVGRIATVVSVADGISDLPNSDVATPATMFFTSVNTTISEGTDCSYTDYTIPVTMTSAIGTSSSGSISIAGAGTTGTDGVDFQLMTTSLTYAAGISGAQNVTIRVFNDSFVEGTETVTINLGVSGGASLGNNSSFVLTINDDDIVPATTQNKTIFSDDFESYTDFSIASIGSWTMIDNDGDATWGSDNTDFTNENYTGSFIVFNPSATTPASGAGWGAHGGNKGFYCFNSNGSVSGTPLNDDYAITPQITNGTNGEIKFWAQSLTDNYNGGERFKIGVSNANDGSGITYVTPTAAPGYVIPPTGTWTEYTYTIPASFDNQNIYVAIQVVSADEFVFMFDDISVTADVTTAIQTAVNDGTTNDQLTIPGAGTVYTSDNTSGDIILDVTNNDAFNYGCTTSAVSRAGTSAQSYNGSTSPDLAMDKIFTITPANTTTSGDTSVQFYFELAEITGWEGVTGESRNNLVAYKESTGEIVTLTVGAFGSNVTLTGNFAGLNGNFLFGTTDTFKRLTVSPRVYLQGAFMNPNTGEESLMRDDLRVAGLLPTTSPYADNLTCNASVFTPTGNDAIVDWVWVELRDKSDNTSVLISQSALLQRDGNVVDTDGVSPVTFKIVSGDYYIAIKHRNHLGIMIKNAATLSGNTTVLDFTNSASQVTYGTNAQISFGMPSGVVAMCAGNVGGDTSVRYQGSGNDTNTIKDQVLADVGNTTSSNLHLFTGYSTADVNLDGSIRYQGSGNDSNTIKDIILAHSDNQISPSNLFLIQEQLPEN